MSERATAFRHGTVDRTAVVLINLGTPAAPEPSAVRRYLHEFLSDSRVVEIPRAVWLPLLHGVILRIRPRATARKYAAIWTPEGSPLLVNSKLQATLLRGYLGNRGFDVDVALAMRYGEPSIGAVLGDLATRQISRLLVIPMYPQYSATTTASALDAVVASLGKQRNLPEVRWVRSFHDDPGYIDALRQSVEAHWKASGRLAGDRAHLVMSFHGVPRRTLDLGDPYHCECQKTGRLLAESLGLAADRYTVSFQSRFGRAEWLKPYTASTLVRLAREGTDRVDVICPGFPADCLETLEEIAIEGKKAFLAAGGKDFGYIACLNGSPPFVHALSGLAARHLGGWPIERAESAKRETDAEKSRARARLMGASE